MSPLPVGDFLDFKGEARGREHWARVQLVLLRMARVVIQAFQGFPDSAEVLAEFAREVALRKFKLPWVLL